MFLAAWLMRSSPVSADIKKTPVMCTSVICVFDFWQQPASGSIACRSATLSCYKIYPYKVHNVHFLFWDVLIQ